MSAPELTEEQTNAAHKDLAATVRYPKIARVGGLPPVARQQVGAVSFRLLPKPVNGVYGMFRVGQNSASMAEFDEYAKNVIRSFDSKHFIVPVDVGAWYPITINDEFMGETLEVGETDDLNNIFHQKESEEERKAKRSVREAKKREQQLMNQIQEQKLDEDSIDYYAQQVMKKMSLESWLEQTRKRKRDMSKALTICNEGIAKLEAEHPEYLDQVDEKIKQIKADIGIGKDAPLGEISVTPNYKQQ